MNSALELANEGLKLPNLEWRSEGLKGVKAPYVFFFPLCCLLALVVTMLVFNLN